MNRQRELADFLRARREAVRPADVGLPDSGRRRTPGLRREELATLAGVSIDYLVRLEQGRDVNPSAGVLAALAQALRLTDEERHHMSKLALVANNGPLCPAVPSLRGPVTPNVRQLLDSLGGTPAFVTSPVNDLLAWNGAWERLASPLGLLDGAPPNLASYVFTDPRARAVYPDWSSVAVAHVSRLRSAELRWRGDSAFRDLLDELGAIPEFESRWRVHDVAEQHDGVQRVHHPSVGELRIAYQVLLVPDDSEQRIVTWLPADRAAEERFHAAVVGSTAASPPQLRVVGR